MLSHSAQGLYWMGRYMERAEHQCRLLRLQVGTLIDRPLREIHFGWRRIYRSIDRPPPAGGEDFELYGEDDLTLTDAYVLADDLTFETSNPSSIWNSFGAGRQNARQVRNRISGEMWTYLNKSYLRLKDVRIQDIWHPTPETFYTETARGIDAFMGVARTTMYRDEGWRFMQMGRFLERSALATAVIAAHLNLTAKEKELYAADWISLLRLFHAFGVYKWQCRAWIEPKKVIKLLTTDNRLPYSLGYALNALATEIAAVPAGTSKATDKRVRQLCGDLCAKVYLEGADKISWAQATLNELHQQIVNSYFDYDITDYPQPKHPPAHEQQQ